MSGDIYVYTQTLMEWPIHYLLHLHCMALNDHLTFFIIKNTVSIRHSSLYCIITVNTICIDIDVLPFLDLGSDANIFTGVDDSSVQFHFPHPFQFNEEMFTFGYVSP